MDETTASLTARSSADHDQAVMKKETRKRRMMRVMVAVDESDYSFYALRWALDHVLAPAGTETVAAEEGSPEEVNMVELLHVQQPFQYYSFPVGPGGTGLYSARLGGRPVYATSAVVESVRKSLEEASAAIMSRALKICKEKPNIKAETLILEGDPKDKICQATEQLHVDLLVVGSRGLGTIKRAFLGSVSDYCAHHAKCPILIVKPPKEAGCK